MFADQDSLSGLLGVSGQYFLTWKTYCPVLSTTARSQTDGGDVSVLEWRLDLWAPHKQRLPDLTTTLSSDIAAVG